VGGYTRYLVGWWGWTRGVGAAVAAGVVPASLEPLYGHRVTAGAAVFFNLRPRLR
jgi:hypothetical protein